MVTKDNVVAAFFATLTSGEAADFNACDEATQFVIACEEMGFDPDAKPRTIPNAVRSFARGFYRSVCMYGRGTDNLMYEGRWDTEADCIEVKTILGETFNVPVAASWLA